MLWDNLVICRKILGDEHIHTKIILVDYISFAGVHDYDNDSVTELALSFLEKNFHHLIFQSVLSILKARYSNDQVFLPLLFRVISIVSNNMRNYYYFMSELVDLIFLVMVDNNNDDEEVICIISPKNLPRIDENIGSLLHYVLTEYVGYLDIINLVKFIVEILYPDIIYSVNKFKNSPLLLYLLQKECNDIHIIDYLIKVGSHLDQRNIYGLTSIDILQRRDYNIDNIISLKCLCTRSIREEGLEIQYLLPSSLRKFVNLH